VASRWGFSSLNRLRSARAGYIVSFECEAFGSDAACGAYCEAASSWLSSVCGERAARRTAAHVSYSRTQAHAGRLTLAEVEAFPFDILGAELDLYGARRRPGECLLLRMDGLARFSFGSCPTTVRRDPRVGRDEVTLVRSSRITTPAVMASTSTDPAPPNGKVAYFYDGQSPRAHLAWGSCMN